MWPFVLALVMWLVGVALRELGERVADWTRNDWTSLPFWMLSFTAKVLAFFLLVAGFVV